MKIKKLYVRITIFLLITAAIGILSQCVISAGSMRNIMRENAEESLASAVNSNTAVLGKYIDKLYAYADAYNASETMLAMIEDDTNPAKVAAAQNTTDAFSKIIPARATYLHQFDNTTDMAGHTKAAIMNTHLALIIEDGKVVKETVTEPGKDGTTTVKETTFGADGKPTGSTETTYDAKGNVVKTVKKDANGNVISDKKDDTKPQDTTLDAAKKTAENKLNNVTTELKKVIDSLSNLTAAQKADLKKQIDTSVANAKKSVNAAKDSKSVDAAYNTGITAAKKYLTDAIKTDINAQVAAAKKAIDDTEGLTNEQKAALKAAIDAEAKKVLDALGTTVDSIVNNAVKGTSADSKPSTANAALVSGVMNKVAGIAANAKTGAKEQADYNKCSTPEKIRKNELNINKNLKVDQVGKKINIKWGKVKDADGYEVYVQYCGKKFGKPVKTIENNSKTKVTVTKVNGKKLKLKKNFKVVVKAYKNVGGKKRKIGKSIAAHIVGVKNKKFTNVKGIKVTNKTTVTVGKGKSHRIKAKTIQVDKSKRQLTDAHAKKFRYASVNPSIATVDEKGVIRGKKKGKTTIYVYARNGYAKAIKVTVK